MTSSALVDPLLRKFNEPLLTFTYFVVDLAVGVDSGVELVLFPEFVDVKYLELTYPSFQFALIFDQPFDSE